jgi:hypothetical protein
MTGHGLPDIWPAVRAVVLAPSQTRWRTRWQPPASRQHAKTPTALVVDTIAAELLIGVEPSVPVSTREKHHVLGMIGLRRMGADGAVGVASLAELTGGSPRRGWCG